MRKVLLAVLAIGGLVGAQGLAIGIPVAEAVNCGDFASQAAAQAYLRAAPSDPDGLDGNDDDGIACENRPEPKDLTPVAAAIGPYVAPTSPAATSTVAPTQTPAATATVIASVTATPIVTATTVPTQTTAGSVPTPISTTVIPPVAAPSTQTTSPVRPPSTGSGGLVR
jgi:hypothetical protein